MTGRAFTAAVALGALLACSSTIAANRSKAVRAEFQREHPCPSTGARRGACPGYQADHKTPLCIGGKDEPANLQWLTVKEHKAKTKRDVRLCRTHP